MRKLKLQMQVSLDGLNSTGPNDEQKWVTFAWEEIKHHVMRIVNSVDTEILGRKLAVDHIPYRLHTSTKPNDPMYELAKTRANQNGKDIIVYGGSCFVSNLVKENLNRRILFINPIALGRGIPIFDKLDDWPQLKLIKAISFKSGIGLLHYKTE